ncbi:gamma-glutamyl-gamma-aminobutyrate hydrolase family protein [Mycolicibacterium sp. CBMA 295]|uniref:gamma-glutamyl-gamma-aminobutyrate hydrolase family protein n=1 Tax=Mycolicibacterium sp. CBMA 295 TaxID=2606605 RepID=UPI001EE3C7A3|nr:gamma-glutamyl-gamma-aminobutyrate hydrolase family protein [Mycolicibacterium sp. CBMA 295]
MRPLIGICGVSATATWGFWRQDAVLAAQTYLDAVECSGGQSLVLVPSPNADAGQLLGVLDGLLLAGGTDIEPEFYGSPATERMEETNAIRDEFELRITTAALERDVPVLGICRGLQILNVATGGTLHQHLLDVGFAEHRPAPGRLDHATHHAIEVDVDSLLGRTGLAGVREVNSHHHQGVASVGRGGRVTARSIPDGAVESIEWPDRHFALGVQWHPEYQPMKEIFDAFVGAAAHANASCTARGRDEGSGPVPRGRDEGSGSGPGNRWGTRGSAVGHRRRRRRGGAQSRTCPA